MIIKQNDNYTYRYKEFVFDTIKGLETVDLDTTAAGSTAFIIEGSRAFILSENGKWKEI